MIDMSLKKQTLVKMDSFIDYMLEHPFDTVRKMAEDLGIPEDTIYGWRMKPEYKQDFWDRVHEKSKAKFSSLESKAIKALEEKVEERDFNAVKYVLDGLEYNSKQKFEVSSPDTISIKITE